MSPYMAGLFILFSRLSEGFELNGLTASASTEYSATFLAENAVDGNVTTGWMSSKTASYSYILVDLHGYYVVNTITIFAGPTFDESRRSDNAAVKLLFSSDPSSPYTCSCGTSPSSVPMGSSFVITCTSGCSARHLIVSKSASLSFAEISVNASHIATNYVQTQGQVVSTPYVTTTTSTASECSVVCFNTPGCRAFSFKGSIGDCQVTKVTGVNVASDWVTYTPSPDDVLLHSQCSMPFHDCC
ncbi:uncharacterized protein LOC124265654 [Haliotis rubra]|uniref:uncharacterized protein LOC124265654 n=1 Tax=Haliotis rubra TaxID=36100 RepID=UPI001EE5D0FF|nr:uncharacterized protein LOC124265654 [Haliotis rubra]